jgi:hypothetical protein
MSSLERVKHYREMAELAGRLAANAQSDDIKLAYMNLATGWHNLAVSLELESEDAPPLIQPQRSRNPRADA